MVIIIIININIIINIILLIVSVRLSLRYDPLLVISRPWVSFDGTVNKDTFKMMEEAVALLVMHKPGIREVTKSTGQI